MKLTEEEKVFGEYLLKEKNDLFIKKQKLELNKIKYILSQLQKAKKIQKDKVEELEKRYKEIQNIISV
jgi:SAM-dependent methyltransferase